MCKSVVLRRPKIQSKSNGEHGELARALTDGRGRRGEGEEVGGEGRMIEEESRGEVKDKAITGVDLHHCPITIKSATYASGPNSIKMTLAVDLKGGSARERVLRSRRPSL